MDKVILIGNHPRDGSESMDRYTRLLWQGLKEKGIAAEILKPKSFFGNLCDPKGGVSKWLRYIDKFVVFPRMLRRRLKQLKRSEERFVVHICDQGDAVYVPWISDVAHVVTCHDMIAIRSALGEFPERPTGGTGRIYQKWILNGLRRASSIVCVSEATRVDFSRIAGTAGQHVSVIKNPLNYPFKPMSASEAAPLLEAVFRRTGRKCPEKYLFHVGANFWYKNRLGLIRIYKALSELCKPPPLVLAGEQPSPELEALIQSENLQGEVLAVGKVSGEELNALYSRSEGLVFPSLMEGFGWPVVEAQACGCAVIASDIAVIKEIAGEGACLIDVSNVANTAGAIRAFLALPQPEKMEQINKGFRNAATYSGPRFLDEYVETYRTLCQQSKNGGSEV